MPFFSRKKEVRTPEQAEEEMRRTLERLPGVRMIDEALANAPARRKKEQESRRRLDIAMEKSRRATEELKKVLSDL